MTKLSEIITNASFKNNLERYLKDHGLIAKDENDESIYKYDIDNKKVYTEQEFKNANIFTVLNENSAAIKSYLDKEFETTQSVSLEELLNAEVENGQLVFDDENKQKAQDEPAEKEYKTSELKVQEDNTVSISTGENSEFNIMPDENNQVSIQQQDGSLKTFDVDDNGNINIPLNEDGSLTLPSNDGNSINYLQNDKGGFDIFTDADGNIISQNNAFADIFSSKGIADVINFLLKDEEVIKLLDNDGNTELDEGEIKTFLNTIASVDGDSSNITFEDIKEGIIPSHLINDSLNQALKNGIDPQKETPQPVNDVIQQNIDSQRARSAASNGYTYSGSGNTIPKSVENKNMSLEELQTKKDEVSNSISQLNSTLSGEIEKNIQEKEEDYNKKEEAYSDAVDKDESLNEFKDDIKANLEKIDECEKNKDEISSSIIETKTQITDINTSISSKHTEIANLKMQIASFKDIQSDDENYSAKTQLEAQLTQAQDALASLENDKTQLEESLSQQEEALEANETALQEALSEKETLDAKVEQYASEKTKTALEDLNSAKAALDSAKNDKAKIQNDIQLKQKELEEIDSQILEKTEAKANKDYSNDPLAMYDEEYGKNLAATAAGFWPNSGYGGYCAAGVSKSLAAASGRDRTYGDAWTYVETMSNRDDFSEYENFDYSSMTSSEVNEMLQGLPSGTVVVWGKNPRNQYGHVAILDGKGNEISDGTNPIWAGYKDRGSSLNIYIPTGA